MNIIRQQTQKISEMAAVMQAASTTCEDEHVIQLKETLTRLLTENRVSFLLNYRRCVNSQDQGVLNQGPKTR